LSVLLQVAHRIFQIYEPTALGCLAALVIAWIALPATFFSYANEPISTSLWLTGLIITSFNIALFASIAVYRLFLSEMTRFPGPRMAALTKWWHLNLSSSGRTPFVIEQLHKKYGDIVRIG
jgi:hypothetical protein